MDTSALLGRDSVSKRVSHFSSQRVISFLWEEMQDQNSPIGRHFAKVDQSFQLDNDVTAYVYKRVSNFEQSDYQYVANYYNEFYPDASKLFYGRILAAANNSASN